MMDPRLQRLHDIHDRATQLVTLEEWLNRPAVHWDEKMWEQYDLGETTYLDLILDGHIDRVIEVAEIWFR